MVPVLADAITLGPYRVDDVETGLAIAEQGDRALLEIRQEVALLHFMRLPALTRPNTVASK